jgi:hypothetical protein
MGPIRDLDDAEKCDITQGVCPLCGGPGFRLGPQGGAAINIECVTPECRQRFNVVMFGARCLHGELIPREADGGGAWPSRDRPGTRHDGSLS